MLDLIPFIIEEKKKKKEERKADKTLEQITVRFAVGAGKSIGGVYL